MRSIKLDNEPYDRGHIAIHGDFSSSPDGKWFIDNATLIAYSDDAYRWHVSQAQEFVDDVIYEITNQL